MITFENLSFSYGNTGEEQLNSLDLQIKKGEFVLLCGRSACGKTTATKCINGLIPHFTEGKYSGSVVVKEKEIAKTPVYEISEDVGSVFQNPKTQFFNLDSDSELVFGMENLGIEPNKINARVQEVAHGLKIENLLGRSVFGLSGGEKQILALASIYAVNPDIYVLDQLFSDSVWEEFSLLNKTVDEQEITKILRRLDLLDYKDKHPMTLSGGQKQRLALAVATLANKDIMIFDEPTSGLDYGNMIKVCELIKELSSNRIVFVATHDRELMGLLCTRRMEISNESISVYDLTTK